MQHFLVKNNNKENTLANITLILKANKNKKKITCVIPFPWNTQNGQIQGDREQMSSCQKLGEGRDY